MLRHRCNGQSPHWHHPILDHRSGRWAKPHGSITDRRSGWPGSPSPTAPRPEMADPWVGRSNWPGAQPQRGGVPSQDERGDRSGPARYPLGEVTMRPTFSVLCRGLLGCIALREEVVQVFFGA